MGISEHDASGAGQDGGERRRGSRGNKTRGFSMRPRERGFGAAEKPRSRLLPVPIGWWGKIY
jgi:hypothetical protein